MKNNGIFYHNQQIFILIIVKLWCHMVCWYPSKGVLKTPIHLIAFMNSWVGKHFLVDKCFPTQEFMNDHRIIYPQYWMALDIEATFLIHLMLLKTHFYHPKQNLYLHLWLVPCCIQQCLINKHISLWLLWRPIVMLPYIHRNLKTLQVSCGDFKGRIFWSFELGNFYSSHWFTDLGNFEEQLDIIWPLDRWPLEESPMYLTWGTYHCVGWHYHYRIAFVAFWQY